LEFRIHNRLMDQRVFRKLYLLAPNFFGNVVSLTIQYSTHLLSLIFIYFDNIYIFQLFRTKFAPLTPTWAAINSILGSGLHPSRSNSRFTKNECSLFFLLASIYRREAKLRSDECQHHVANRDIWYLNNLYKDFILVIIAI
jgi:hypothetical protein